MNNTNIVNLGQLPDTLIIILLYKTIHYSFLIEYNNYFNNSQL